MELARLAGLSRAEREYYDRELMAQQDQRGMLSYAQKAGFSEGHIEGVAEGLAEGLREAIWP